MIELSPEERAAWAAYRQTAQEFVECHLTRAGLSGPCEPAQQDGRDVVSTLGRVLLTCYLSAVAKHEGEGARVSEREMVEVMCLTASLTSEAILLVVNPEFLAELRSPSLPPEWRN